MSSPNKLYQSVVPLRNDATTMYSKGRIAPINAEKLYTIIGGKKVLKSSLNKQDDTLQDLGGEPGTGRTLNEKAKGYWKPFGGRVQTNIEQLKDGVGKGLVKTVGASAAMATGAAYSTPVVGTLSALAKNVIAGGVGMEGFAMLDGRTATPTELAIGAGMEMGMPLAIKGISGTYGKMFANKTVAPIFENTIQETVPVVKKESIYQSTPFQIEQPTTNILQLKSTMIGSPLEKQLSKDGTLSINSLQAHLNNQSTSMADRTMIQKVLDEKFAGQGKINYNDLRKAVSEEMVPLEKNFDSNFSNYGISNIGYHTSKTKPIIDLDDEIRGYTEMANNQTYNETTRNSYRLHLDELKKRKANELLTPQENTSIVYSNKDKFGRGSTDHFENEGTLGHSRILVSNEEKDVMHVLEQQSDFYQKHSPEEIGMSVELEKNIKRLDDLYQLRRTELKEILENKNGNFTSKDVLQQERLISSQYEALRMAKADLSNIEQKSLLGKTHQERLLQENVAYAAQNGQTKMRYPTPETAAKIQGYKPKKSLLNESELDMLHPDSKSDIVEYTSGLDRADIDYETQIGYLYGRLNNYKDSRTFLESSEIANSQKANYEHIKERIPRLEHDIQILENLKKTKSNEYRPEHQTILKKYNDNPKIVKKVLGQDTRTVTDAKGNTWFEFDIPDAFRKGKAEIKALSTVGAIATGYKAIADKNKNK